MKTTNALTVDVEDYFHVSAFSNHIDRNHWDRYPCRVEANTRLLLGMFSEADVKATFFVLGWVAERYPALVREIAARGHEVACHGYSHELVYHQTPAVFREESKRAKDVLEDIIQKPINGYRAASYSITPKSTWALDVLAELGFRYDSSIFPVRHDRYGIPGARREPHIMSTPAGHALVEFPLSTLQVFRYRLPVAGGGYFRLFPYWFTRYALSRINAADGLPYVFYLHPWEIDPDQPRVSAGMLSRFRHYQNLGRCQERLVALLQDFSFDTVEHVLTGLGLLTVSGDTALDRKKMSDLASIVRPD
jgi:polysaccharide deacetylase family protein (PEP-CTERM system associated)